VALVWGAPERVRGVIEAELGRSSKNREKMTVVAAGRGRHAVTRYRTEAVFGQKSGEPVASLVRCELETGRTHQIRVHMAHLGHPLLGDKAYGAGFKTKASRLSDEARDSLAALGRQALHAAVLGFAHPTSGRTLRFERPPPEDMARLTAALRNMP
jgi:23S rRNA pseudouridine1911/1915/1917 synthase